MRTLIVLALFAVACSRKPRTEPAVCEKGRVVSVDNRADVTIEVRSGLLLLGTVAPNSTTEYPLPLGGTARWQLPAGVKRASPVPIEQRITLRYRCI